MSSGITQENLLSDFTKFTTIFKHYKIINLYKQRVAQSCVLDDINKLMNCWSNTLIFLNQAYSSKRYVLLESDIDTWELWDGKQVDFHKLYDKIKTTAPTTDIFETGETGPKPERSPSRAKNPISRPRSASVLVNKSSIPDNYITQQKSKKTRTMSQMLPNQTMSQMLPNQTTQSTTLAFERKSNDIKYKEGFEQNQKQLLRLTEKLKQTEQKLEEALGPERYNLHTVKQLRMKLDVQTKVNKELDAQIKPLQEQLDELKEKERQLTTQIEKDKEQYEQDRKEYGDYRNNTESTLTNLHRALEEALEEKKLLEGKLKKNTATIDEKDRLLAAADDTIKQQKTALQNQTTKDHETRLWLETKLKKATESIKELTQSIKVLESQNRDLRQSFENIPKQQPAILNNQKGDNLADIMNEFESDSDDEVAVANLDQEQLLEQLKQEMIVIQGNISQLRQEKTKNNDEIQSLRKQLEEQKKLLEEERAHVIELTTQNKEHQSKYALIVERLKTLSGLKKGSNDIELIFKNITAQLATITTAGGQEEEKRKQSYNDSTELITQQLTESFEAQLAVIKKLDSNTDTTPLEGEFNATGGTELDQLRNKLAKIKMLQEQIENTRNAKVKKLEESVAALTQTVQEAQQNAQRVTTSNTEIAEQLVRVNKRLKESEAETTRLREQLKVADHGVRAVGVFVNKATQIQARRQSPREAYLAYSLLFQAWNKQQVKTGQIRARSDSVIKNFSKYEHSQKKKLGANRRAQSIDYNVRSNPNPKVTPNRLQKSKQRTETFNGRVQSNNESSIYTDPSVPTTPPSNNMETNNPQSYFSQVTQQVRKIDKRYVGIALLNVGFIGGGIYAIVSYNQKK